ncbi:MAG TPA: VTT domain-containing protein [Negativicutes bacterium]
METLITILLSWGLLGLVVAAFTESFCSPVLPDLVLIPLALAQPEHAIYYGVVATAASVIGGFIGYGIGYKIGLPAVRKIIPAKYQEKILMAAEKNAKWAIFLAAISPIPYKFVSITAGALRIKFTVFVIVSSIGRAKRFLLEGILIYYYGPRAVQIFTEHSEDLLILSLVIVAVGLVAVYALKRMKRNAALERN